MIFSDTEKTIIGQKASNGVFVRLSENDRLRHIYTIGKTGSGKTTFIKNLVGQDLADGYGVCVIDPHGDLAEEILDLVPRHRADETVYFNAGDTFRPTGFNPLELKDPNDIDRITSAVISACKSQWLDSWGPRLEDALRNAILALLEAPKITRPTLLSIPLMLTSRLYREQVLRHCTNDVVLNYWHGTFEQFRPQELASITSPVTNKVNAFSSSPLMQNILGQYRSTFSLRKVMNEKGVLIVNLAKGKIGADNANLLGSLIVASIQAEAMARVGQSKQDRQPFYVHIDEFQNFSTNSFSEILSEARKFKLGLTLAHQFISQVKESVISAVIGNVQTMVIFAVGGGDAEKLKHEVKPYPPERLTEGSTGQGYLIESSKAEPFESFPPLDKYFKKRAGAGKGIKQNSRIKFALGKKEAERLIKKGFLRPHAHK